MMFPATPSMNTRLPDLVGGADALLTGRGVHAHHLTGLVGEADLFGGGGGIDENFLSAVESPDVNLLPALSGIDEDLLPAGAALVAREDVDLLLVLPGFEDHLLATEVGELDAGAGADDREAMSSWSPFSASFVPRRRALPLCISGFTFPSMVRICPARSMIRSSSSPSRSSARMVWPVSVLSRTFRRGQ